MSSTSLMGTLVDTFSIMYIFLVIHTLMEYDQVYEPNQKESHALIHLFKLHAGKRFFLLVKVLQTVLPFRLIFFFSTYSINLKRCRAQSSVSSKWPSNSAKRLNSLAITTPIKARKTKTKRFMSTIFNNLQKQLCGHA